MFVSTKSYPDLGPVAYRQWRAESHCALIHGYSLSFYFEFESETLDARNWVVDFGSLRPLKDKLEEWFDHTMLVAADDPDFDAFKTLYDRGLINLVEVEKTGCEGLSDWLYDYINEIFLPDHGYGDRVWCRKVMVQEHANNSAWKEGHRP
jgi:6-pyruvoyltetrahydropterin/6-carboxytetrahydropterin synthase